MSEVALFPRNLASQFRFDFFLHFMLDPDPNPAPEPELRKKLRFLRFRFHNTARFLGGYGIELFEQEG